MGRKPEGKAEKMFKKVGKKIDELLVDLEKAKEEAKVEYADRIEDIKRGGETLKDEAHRFYDDNKDVFDNIEERLKNVGQDVKEAVDKAFGKQEDKEEKEKP